MSKFAVVRNNTISGKPIIEGVAAVRRELGDDRYKVKFTSNSPCRDNGLYERYVSPEDLFATQHEAEYAAIQAAGK